MQPMKQLHYRMQTAQFSRAVCKQHNFNATNFQFCTHPSKTCDLFLKNFCWPDNYYIMWSRHDRERHIYLLLQQRRATSTSRVPAANQKFSINDVAQWRMNPPLRVNAANPCSKARAADRHRHDSGPAPNTTEDRHHLNSFCSGSGCLIFDQRSTNGQRSTLYAPLGNFFFYVNCFPVAKIVFDYAHPSAPEECRALA